MKQRLRSLLPFVIAVLIVSATVALVISETDRIAENERYDNYVRTICLVEGYPDYIYMIDWQGHRRGFCLNSIESVELPMHPDLELP